MRINFGSRCGFQVIETTIRYVGENLHPPVVNITGEVNV